MDDRLADPAARDPDDVADPEPIEGPFKDLTARERQVAALVGRGMTNAEIGRALDLSPKTIKNHLSRIFERLRMHSRIQLGIYAHRHGLDHADK